MTNGSLLGTASNSPFSPDFGKTPHSLVGRDSLLAEVGSGLVSGPFPRPKCRKFMPRAKAYCLLPQDHSRGCRSNHP